MNQQDSIERKNLRSETESQEEILQRAREQDTAGKTENFASRNVKTITFVCCLVVFLIFFGPWNISRMIDWVKEITDTRVEMTLADVVTLSERGTPFTLSDLRAYVGSEDFHEDENEVYYMISLDGGHTLLGVFNYNSNTMRYLTLVTYDGQAIDVLTENVRQKLNFTDTGIQE